MLSVNRRFAWACGVLRAGLNLREIAYEYRSYLEFFDDTGG
jgi:hypothetical protein